MNAVHPISQHSCSALRAWAAVSLGATGRCLPWYHCAQLGVLVLSFPVSSDWVSQQPQASADYSPQCVSDLYLRSVTHAEDRSGSKSNSYSRIFTYLQCYPPLSWFLFQSKQTNKQNWNRACRYKI